jgi:hypothetical protein
MREKGRRLALPNNVDRHPNIHLLPALIRAVNRRPQRHPKCQPHPIPSDSPRDCVCATRLPARRACFSSNANNSRTTDTASLQASSGAPPRRTSFVCTSARFTPHPQPSGRQIHPTPPTQRSPGSPHTPNPAVARFTSHPQPSGRQIHPTPPTQRTPDSPHTPNPADARFTSHPQPSGRQVHPTARS